MVTIGVRAGVVVDARWPMAVFCLTVPLPRLVQQLGRGDLAMVHTETWSRVDGGPVRGRINIAISRTPVSAAGAALVAPQDDGPRLQYSATVKVNLPLVGGQIEKLMSGRLADGILDIQRFTAAWIAENG